MARITKRKTLTMVLQKLQYLIRSFANANQTKVCPNCGAKVFTVVDQKYFVTKLLKCTTCKLNFRFPTDSRKFSESFYNSDYHADYSEITKDITDLPHDSALQEMMKNNFYGKRDYSPFVKAVTKRSDSKVIDFGCSWGYSVYQLKNAGYDAEGFEVSRSRASFGRKLSVKIDSDTQAVRSGNDVILSSHTIEHLPVVSDLIDFAKEKLTKDGYLVCFCPNGSAEFRQRSEYLFHVNWGFLHPNYLDIEFAKLAFKSNPYLILTGDWKYDYDFISNWDQNSQVVGEKKDGEELLMIARPNIEI